MPKLLDDVQQDTPANDIPKTLAPYIFHGLDLQEQGKQAVADCPFCGREGKFSVNIETGLWRCLVCATGSDKGGGNAYTFLRHLWEFSDKATNGECNELALHRNLLYPDSLMHWGVAKSVLSKQWVVPGYSPEGKLNQLYKYQNKILRCTTGTSHQLFGPNLYSKGKEEVYLCEGPWDAIALWEVMRAAKLNKDGTLSLTANDTQSLMANANILATPGANVFFDKWATLFEDKRVFILYDNDHPFFKENLGREIEGAGPMGARRVANILASCETPPKEINFLNWGPYGYTKELPDGYDVRDMLGEGGKDLAKRIEALAVLRSMLAPIPDDWIQGRSKDTSKKGGTTLELKECKDWKVLVNACRKAMKWIPGLDCSFSVMLASILSVPATGDQLWVKIIGPASCGKSVLCEALSVNYEYIVAKSTIRGFHSGYRETNEDDEDNSLISICNNRTLITKDGDTLLQAPNLGQILSEARDIYDRASRTHYRNKASKDYNDIAMTWILCGTNSLRFLDSSELGERFLDCEVISTLDEDLEDEIQWRVANRASRDVCLDSNSANGAVENPDMVLMKQLTGGYINYLREKGLELVAAIPDDEEPLRQCTALARFVSYMRARPSKKQKEKAEREMPYRLTSQIVRLAKCLTAVIGEKTMNENVMRRVTKVAFDTARGRTLDIVRYLFATEDPLHTDYHNIAIHTGHPAEEEKELVRFMRKIGILETFPHKIGNTKKTCYRLTERFRKTYVEVIRYS